MGVRAARWRPCGSGAGGAARAVAVALVDQDLELAIWSRRLSNARALLEKREESPAYLLSWDPSFGTMGDLKEHIEGVGAVMVEGFPILSVARIRATTSSMRLR